MSSCSIRWCGKNSKRSNFLTDGITFHRFPKDPDLKAKWIACSKRENWFPSKHSVVCSRHFTEDCFYTAKNRRRLWNTAFPTLHLPVVTDITATSACPPENTRVIPAVFQYAPKTPSATKRKLVDPITDPQLHSLTTKRLCRRVLELSNQVRHKNKTIKLLQDKVRYYQKKLASLKVEKEKKIVIKTEDEELEKTSVIKTEDEELEKIDIKVELEEEKIDIKVEVEEDCPMPMSEVEEHGLMPMSEVYIQCYKQE